MVKVRPSYRSFPFCNRRASLVFLFTVQAPARIRALRLKAGFLPAQQPAPRKGAVRTLMMTRTLLRETGLLWRSPIERRSTAWTFLTAPRVLGRQLDRWIVVFRHVAAICARSYSLVPEDQMPKEGQRKSDAEAALIFGARTSPGLLLTDRLCDFSNPLECDKIEGFCLYPCR